MKKSGRRMMVMLFLVAFVAGCSSTNWVARPGESKINRAPRKLARGVVNIVSGPFEIFNQPVRLAKKEDRLMPQVGGVLAGIPVGLAYGVGRTLAGTFDIVTAPILTPERAAIEPEFISPDLLEWAFEQ
jgi:putative exosortase-associated protein (TIGR04073 family)